VKGPVKTRIKADSVVWRQREPLFTRLNDDMLALDSRAGRYYILNVSAARVWELLDAPTTPREVCKQLGAEYEVDAARCATDVIALMEELRAAGLVAVSEGGEL
jgi:hypothetical protein